MVNKFVNNPHDLVEERLVWMEAQVSYLNCNMSLLMVVFTNKIRLFIEDGCSNVDSRTKGKLIDWEEQKRESMNEHENEQPSSSAMTH